MLHDDSWPSASPQPSSLRATCNCCGCRMFLPRWPTWRWAFCVTGRSPADWHDTGTVGAASAGLYLAGMVLNDCSTSNSIAREGPSGRCLPGESPGRAGPAGLGLLALG